MSSWIGIQSRHACGEKEKNYKMKSKRATFRKKWERKFKTMSVTQVTLEAIPKSR